MADAEELIYQNANTYRLHADNLRWSLLGGFAAFLAAVFSLSQSQAKTIKLDSAFLSGLAFLVSFAYLWIIAVQNWFYNLFARFADDCEARLVADKKMQSLQSFARAKGREITPFHPAFILAELIVASVAYYFLCATADNIYWRFSADLMRSLGPDAAAYVKVVGYMFYIAALHVAFANWHTVIYKPIIVTLSNIYKQVDTP